jgi:hypothetical protein
MTLTEIKTIVKALEVADLRSLRATINALLSHQSGAKRKSRKGIPLKK